MFYFSHMIGILDIVAPAVGINKHLVVFSAQILSHGIDLSSHVSSKEF